jgi:hypothetical protein
VCEGRLTFTTDLADLAYAKDAYDCACDGDALVLVTE